MKTKLLIFLSCFLLNKVYCQEDIEIKNGVYLYSTVEDFKNQKETYAGTYVSYSWNFSSQTKLFCELNKKKNEISLKKYWGFRIGQTLFRLKKSNPKMPLQVLGLKDKVFYLNGYFSLNELSNGDTSTSNSPSKNIFYSNNLSSEILHIEKLISKEKNNEALKTLCTCIKKGKKRHGYQAKFNGKSKCITKHLSVE